MDIMEMENKGTAMRQFIEWMIEESQVIPVQAEECYNKAKELLETEKEQIINAHIKGHYAPSSTLKYHDAEQYYNETYN